MNRLPPLLFLLMALTGISHAQSTLRIRGSDTLGAKLMTSLAEAYKKQGNQVSFDIGAEGSSTGFSTLAAGSADMAMSSRKVKPDERAVCRSKGVKLFEIEFAWDMICVIVHRDNPINALSKKQLMQVFCGDIADWSELGGAPGPLSVYTRNTSSGTYRDFAWMAMKDRKYGERTQKMAGNEQIAAEVGANLRGIGYVGHAFTGGRSVKIVAVDRSWPDPARIKDYPLARPTYLYTNGEPQGGLKAFVDFCLSPAGAAIINKNGFVALGQGQGG